MEINRAAVIGAGVMGSGIAAHIANAGVPVLLLDIVPKDAPEGGRSAIAEGAVASLLKTDPAPFMHRRNARLVTPGNIEDDLEKLADCDWILEAVLEDPKIKQSLYKKIEKHRKKGSRHAEGLCRGFPGYSFLQPAALHAAAGDRIRSEDQCGGDTDNS
jgi:3-hydroxyacyl-CoA dehydrogenase